jgi:hypothetical protein
MAGYLTGLEEAFVRAARGEGNRVGKSAHDFVEEVHRQQYAIGETFV